MGRRHNWIDGTLLFICKSNNRKEKNTPQVNSSGSIYISVFKTAHVIMPKQSFVCLVRANFALRY